jgi:hypothetical protein
MDEIECRLSFRTSTPTRDLFPLGASTAAGDIELERITVRRPGLEDGYVQLTEDPA